GARRGYRAGPLWPRPTRPAPAGCRHGRGSSPQTSRSYGARCRPAPGAGPAAWGAIGNYMLLFLAGLQSIPDDIYESASIDGATKVQQFWYMTVPLLAPIMQIVIMLAIINSLKGYESIMVLTEGGPIGRTEVMFLYVYKLLFPMPSAGATLDPQFGYGSAVGFVTAIIVGMITLVYQYMSRKMNKIN
ncbi:MAG: sugar ABC transporter permease, partial [Gorillibacterium sp.]|nr:sugar ABC transporter permease [Gorillibacterium sp.]